MWQGNNFRMIFNKIIREVTDICADFIAVQGLHNRLVIHNAIARKVDNNHAVTHDSQALLVNQVSRRIQQGYMKGYKIGFIQHLFY